MSEPVNVYEVLGLGALRTTVMEAAAKAAGEGIGVEVVDLRTLVPLDFGADLDSVKKTGRAVIVYEAPKIMGYGAEISAFLAEEALDHLKAPIVRVGGFDTRSHVHENLYMPTVPHILKAIHKVFEH